MKTKRIQDLHADTAAVQVSQCVVIMYEVFSSSSTSPWHTKGTMHFLRPCTFWLLQCNFHAFVFLDCSVRSILSTVYWEREHRHDLHDVAVTSGHAFRKLSMVLSPLWCLEMAWGHSSWSSVNLSFLLTLCAAKHASLWRCSKINAGCCVEGTWQSLKAFYDTMADGFSHSIVFSCWNWIIWFHLLWYIAYINLCYICNYLTVSVMCRENCRRQKAYISENNKCCFP